MSPKGTLIKTRKMPQINRNSIYRRALNKLNRDYNNSIRAKVIDGIPLFIQRMSNDPEMNEVYRIEGEKRYYDRMLKKHIIDFQFILKECQESMGSLMLIGTRKNISHNMLAYNVSNYLF